MEYTKLRKRLSFLKRTPFHPQWLIYRRERKNLTEIGSALHGRVLDLGCSDQRLKVFLKNETRYIGLDYYDTAEHWYQTKPQVYGDAAALPFLVVGTNIMLWSLAGFSQQDDMMPYSYRLTLKKAGFSEKNPKQGVWRKSR